MVSIPVFGDNPTISPDSLQCMDCQKNCNVQYPLPLEPNATALWENCINDCSKAFPQCHPVTIPPSPKATKKPQYVITGMIKSITPISNKTFFNAYCNNITYKHFHWLECECQEHPKSGACDIPSVLNESCKDRSYVNSHYQLCFCKDNPEGPTCGLPYYYPTPTVTSLSIDPCKNSSYLKSHSQECFCRDNREDPACNQNVYVYLNTPTVTSVKARDACKDRSYISSHLQECFCKIAPDTIECITPTPTVTSGMAQALTNPCKNSSYAVSHPDKCALKLASPVPSYLFLPSFTIVNTNEPVQWVVSTYSTPIEVRNPIEGKNPFSGNTEIKVDSPQTSSGSGLLAPVSNFLIKGPSFLSNVTNTSISLNTSINLTNLSFTKTKVLKK